MAVQFSYRADELPAGDPFYPRAGTPRGNSGTLDWYYTFNLRFKYLLFDAGPPKEGRASSYMVVTGHTNGEAVIGHAGSHIRFNGNSFRFSRTNFNGFA
jgi:hypothetical protein